MKTFVMRALVLSAALGLAGAAAAQRTVPIPGWRGGEPNFRNTHQCSAQGASCFWGESGGCSVTCVEPLLPVCEGGYCTFFGFPKPAKCFCTGMAS